MNPPRGSGRDSGGAADRGNGGGGAKNGGSSSAVSIMKLSFRAAPWGRALAPCGASSLTVAPMLKPPSDGASNGDLGSKRGLQCHFNSSF